MTEVYAVGGLDTPRPRGGLGYSTSAAPRGGLGYSTSAAPRGGLGYSTSAEGALIE